MGKKKKVSLLLLLGGAVAGGIAARNAARKRDMSPRDVAALAKDRVVTAGNLARQGSAATQRTLKFMRMAKQAGWQLGGEGKIDVNAERALLRIVTDGTLVILKLSDDGESFTIDQIGYEPTAEVPVLLRGKNPTYAEFLERMTSNTATTA